MLLLWILIAVLLWIGLAGVASLIASGPRRDPYDIIDGVLLLIIRILHGVLHKPTYEGLENIEAAADVLESGDRPIIVLANHTAGIDPLLIQNTTRRFEIRWMMAADMRVDVLDALWNWSRIILVEGSSADTAPLREALRHLKKGGALGIFPEGGIERPERQIMAFQTGVGMLIKRSGALVLPVIIEGTPQVDPAFASLWHPGQARVRFLPLIDYKQKNINADEIREALQSMYLRETGWPLNESLAQPSRAGHQSPITVPA